jgi:copper homeostasis protein (lipoprotein)
MQLVMLTAVALLVVLTACAPASRTTPTGSAAALAAPATYAGDLPCADCTAIRTTLNLRPDGLFLLRQTYLGARAGRDESFYDLGHWQLLPDKRTVVLKGDSETPRRFAVRDGATLRLLDTEGREIDSTLNYDLQRTAAPDPFSEPWRLRGLYTYMADAAALQECQTAKRFPVAAAGESLLLERAYLASRSAPGAPLLVTLDGHFEIRPGMEDGSKEEVIVVDRFQRVWPGETCANRLPAVPLVGTRWLLTQIGGSLPPRATGEQPWLELRPELGRAQGFSGCNRFSGRYELVPDGLRFTQVATTRMFCVGRMDLEEAFTGVLGRVTGYRIDGVDLALTGNGETLAWFREGTS